MGSGSNQKVLLITTHPAFSQWHTVRVSAVLEFHISMLNCTLSEHGYFLSEGISLCMCGPGKVSSMCICESNLKGRAGMKPFCFYQFYHLNEQSGLSEILLIVTYIILKTSPVYYLNIVSLQYVPDFPPKGIRAGIRSKGLVYTSPPMVTSSGKGVVCVLPSF